MTDLIFKALISYLKDPECINTRQHPLLGNTRWNMRKTQVQIEDRLNKMAQQILRDFSSMMVDFKEL
jgi:hypothetical protein